MFSSPKRGLGKAVSIAGAALLALAALASCASLPDLASDTRVNVRKLAAQEGGEGLWAKLRPAIDRAKKNPNHHWDVACALSDWADYHLARKEANKALALLDEIATLALPANEYSMPRRLLLRRAIATFELGQAEEALNLVAEAKKVIDPKWPESLDVFSGLTEVYILQSLGRYAEASKAGIPYFEDRYSSQSCKMIDAVLAWNALHDGEPQAALRYATAIESWRQPHGALLLFLAQLAITGPAGAERQAKTWLQERSPSSRQDWLMVDSIYPFPFPIEDCASFYRAKFDDAELLALAAYSVALGPNQTSSGYPDPLPVSSEKARAAGDPYAVDYAYAEAIYAEGRHAVNDDAIRKRYAAAAALGKPRLPYGMAAHAAFEWHTSYTNAAAKAIANQGKALFPRNIALFALMEVPAAIRSMDVDRIKQLVDELFDNPKNVLERECLGAITATIFENKGTEILEKNKEIWKKDYPDSIALLYFDSYIQYAKYGNTGTLNPERENADAWLLYGRGDPLRALVYGMLKKIAGR